MFPVALLLLNSKSLSKRFVDSIRTVRAKIVSGSKGGFQRDQLLRVAANLLWILSRMGCIGCTEFPSPWPIA
jgi:hypothetical protein